MRLRRASGPLGDGGSTYFQGCCTGLLYWGTHPSAPQTCTALSTLFTYKETGVLCSLLSRRDSPRVLLPPHPNAAGGIPWGLGAGAPNPTDQGLAEEGAGLQSRPK